MKKVLLSFLAVASVYGYACADTVTLNVNEATDIDGTLVEEVLPSDQNKNGAAKHYQPLKSFKLGDYTLSFGGSGKTATAYYYPTSAAAEKGETQNTVRLYKDNTLTFTAPAGKEFGKIVFSGSNGTDGAAVSATVGSVTATTTVQTWTNGSLVNTVTLTYPGSFRIKTIEVSDEVSSTPVGSGLLLSENDANGDEGWTYENISKPDSIDVWSWKLYNGKYYMNASAYVGGKAIPTEAWTVSPAVTLNADAKSVNFEHTAKFQTTLRELCGFGIREEGKTEWTMLTIGTWPEAGSWNFVNSGDIDVSAYAGKKVQFGFKYGSTAEGADTWEIRNLSVPAEVGGAEPPVADKATFKKVNALETGDYVFVIGTQVGAPAAADLSYGRMTLVDAEVSGEIVTCDPAYAYTVTVADGKATIKANGKFYSMDDSHFTSFQFYTEEMPGNYWTYEFEGDNVKFTNDLNKDCIISQTKGTSGTWYTNIAPAKSPEEFNLPVLYKLDPTLAVEGVDADENAPVVYYNLQGVKVAEPEHGLYIRVQGKKAVKVIL